MICTVTLNPALDLTLCLSSLEQGKINRSLSERLAPGGKGINVSLVLKSFGVKSFATGFAGGGSGEILLGMLQRELIPCDFLSVKGMTRINVKLRAEEETDINGAGPDVSLSAVRALAASLSEENFSVLVLAGSLPRSLPSDAYAVFLENFRGKDVRIVADVSGKALADILPFSPWLVKPNLDELGELFGVRIGGREEAFAYARKLRERGAQNVIVSLGGEGALMVDEEGKEYFVPAFEGVPMDTVGAGDSLLGAFLACREQGMSVRDSLEMGVAAGSATAFRHGLATAEEARALLSARKNRT